MSDQSWDKPLETHQIANPIIEGMQIQIPEVCLKPTDEMMDNLFPLKSKTSLQTWGRQKGQHKGLDPHWIRIKRGTPLHTDPLYPRYSHHLVLKADGYLRGIDKIKFPIERGTVYILDSHSPHQLYCNDDGKDYWYLAVSLDNDKPIRVDEVFEPLLEYALTAEFIKKTGVADG